MTRKILPLVAAGAVALGATAIPSLAAGTKTVAVKDDVFAPKRLTISKGTRVVWVWKGRAQHNVSVIKGPEKFRAGTRKKGRYGHTFKKRGTYRLLCTIHAPDMKMSITVR